MINRLIRVALPFLLLTLQAPLVAAASAVPEPFRGHDGDSKLAISYDDLTELLRAVVIDRGSSDRGAAEVPPDQLGTRLKPQVKKRTANEGNRFFFETFQDNEAAQQYLKKIQDNLTRLPDDVPLARFSRDEQLAYWLNLYNVTLLNEIIAIYPKRNLKRYFKGRNSLFRRKILVVAGVPLSLDDIQFTILRENYDNDPLILYGLYQGIVGGPDIRPAAYTGVDVYNALEDNAYEFVNSNRGTFYRRKSPFRVSSFYARSEAYFPDFDEDLSTHLADYLQGAELVALEETVTLQADLDDWTVTDLGGTQQEIGGGFSRNQAALLDSYRSNRRTPNGGYRAASLEVNRDKPERNKDKVTAEELEEARIEGMEQAPVEGAAIEELATDDAD